MIPLVVSRLCFTSEIYQPSPIVKIYTTSHPDLDFEISDTETVAGNVTDITYTAAAAAADNHGDIDDSQDKGTGLEEN